MSEANKALASRFHFDLFQEGDLEAADEILSPDFVWHGEFGPGEDRRGPEPAREMAAGIAANLPDWRIAHEDAIAEGDKVVIRWTIRATQGGTPMRVTGIDLFRVEGGKIAELWQEADVLGMRRQLGLIPEPGPEEEGSGS
jgi:ketosteroid isomerase-like protein